MKVVFMGTPDFSVRTLEALVEAGYEITGVVTQPDKPKGRGKQMMPTPVKEAAEKHGLPVYQPRRVRDAEAIEEFQKRFWTCRNTDASTFMHPCFRLTAEQRRSSGLS